MSTKPWALSPLIATMPHFAHKRLPADAEEPTFPPIESLKDSIEELHLTVIDESATSSGGTSPSSSASSLESVSSTASKDASRSKSSALSVTRGSPSRSRKKRPTIKTQTLQLREASERRAFFSKEKNRKPVIFGPEVSGVVSYAPKLGF